MMRLAILILLSLLCSLWVCSSIPRLVPSQMIADSQVSFGNLARLQRVMSKAQHGGSVTIGFIGGSITFGQQATTADRQYADQVTAWWVEHFPRSKITMVNAGVRGTGSNYGCLRESRDLLAYHSDFVVVEFGVNDRDDLAHAETYEGVVRQLMTDPDNPAVLLLFMMHHDGTNAQALQSEIGRNYQLPMVSFRDAVWPEIAAGRMKVSDVLADTVHLNDRGHALAARCIISVLDEAKNQVLVQPKNSLSSPRFTDLFATTDLVEARDLNAISVVGWRYDKDKRCWIADQPGSVVEFEISGRAVNFLYSRVSPYGGTVAVTVDDGSPIFCDSWFDGSWVGHCQTDLVGRDLSPAMHRVRIELLDQKNALSLGHEFEILGLGSAGN